MIFSQILYALFCIGLAYDNSLRIKKGKKINHWLNALFHIVVTALAVVAWGLFGIVFLFIARLVFDTSLSLFRGLPLDYVPVKPESWCDRVEKKLFNKNGIIPKVTYLVIIIVLNIVK